MEKINWINGQAGGTPLSAENLNQMQDNIEDAIEDLKNNVTTGQEVVTNQYIDGKRVYTKRIDCGYAPNNTHKNISHGLNNVTFIKIEGIGYKNNSLITYPLPFAYADSDRIGIWTDETGIKVQTWADKTDFHIFVNLYYTKNNE